MKKVLRVSTVPMIFDWILKGQLKMLSEHYEIVVVSSPGESLDIVSKREGVRTCAVPIQRHISVFKDIVSLVRLIRLFAKEKPDMVHSVTPKAGLLSMFAAWVTGVPVRMHTFTGLVFPTAIGLMQKLLIMTDRITCACATNINPEGYGVKRDLERFNITSKPLRVFANGNVNGIDLNFYQRTDEVMRKAEKYTEKGCFTFCFVGRIVRDKGINELIHAFDRLYKRYPFVRLILVGIFEELSPLDEDVRNIIRNHNGIKYVGQQSDVRPFYAASQALVFPSYREGFPNVVIEAGAMGLPSIVTDINGSNEIIIPNRNGVIIPSRNEDALYDAMETFANDKSLVKKMADEARELIASRFDRKIVWDALLEEYRNLLGE